MATSKSALPPAATLFQGQSPSQEIIRKCKKERGVAWCGVVADVDPLSRLLTPSTSVPPFPQHSPVKLPPRKQQEQIKGHTHLMYGIFPTARKMGRHDSNTTIIKNAETIGRDHLAAYQSMYEQQEKLHGETTAPGPTTTVPGKASMPGGENHGTTTAYHITTSNHNNNKSTLRTTALGKSEAPRQLPMAGEVWEKEAEDLVEWSNSLDAAPDHISLQ